VINSLTSIITPDFRRRSKVEKKEQRSLVTVAKKCVRELLGGFRMRKNSA
jgi:hypothetical protein